MEVTFKTLDECRVELAASTFVEADVNADMLPVRAARISFANDDQEPDEKRDLKLMRYLGEHEHLTPFEYQHATVMVELPLFILEQFKQHRTLTINSISRRYTSEELAFWKPEAWRKQAKNNKQASIDETIPYLRYQTNYEETVYWAMEWYGHMLDNGVCREQARAILPQGLLTRVYMGGNLRNWAAFLKLRLADNAQYEARVIAAKIEGILRSLWPNSTNALLGDAKLNEGFTA